MLHLPLRLKVYRTSDASTCPTRVCCVQVLRVLVLLDESEVAARQEGRPRLTPGHVVAEILVSRHNNVATQINITQLEITCRTGHPP
jgi:hypothetical protein